MNNQPFFLSRRNFLKLASGGLVGAGLQLQFPSLFADESVDLSKAKADHIIYLFMNGGMSHIDTFDPKPGTDVQGEFKTIESSNGKIICEYLPGLAKIMDRVALINSMTSKEGSHERGQYMFHTNYAPLGTIVHPTLGSWITKFTKPINTTLPAHISIGGSRFGSGYFGSKFEPLYMGNAQSGLANAKLPKDLTQAQFNERLGLLNDLDKDFQTKFKEANIQAYNDYYKDANKLMFSEDLKVFDINTEPEEMKVMYGKNDFGNGCLLARRLVEKGVKYIEVTNGGWDTHENNFESLKTKCDVLDKGLSSLILDLEKKGLLKKTLIVLTTEFGRTPKINAKKGRDHFPNAFSCLMAGGGVKGGTVIGKTNDKGDTVTDQPISIYDVNTTIAVAAGLNPDKEVISPIGRPFKLSNTGKVIDGIFA